MALSTMSNLISDVLPRLARVKKTTGISIYQAANSTQSLIYKRLLNWRSDLLASGDLDLTITANTKSVSLPDDFVSMAERPRIKFQDYGFTNQSVWLAGTVSNYTSSSGALQLNINSMSPNAVGYVGTLNAWVLAIVQPDKSLKAVGASTTSLTLVTGPQSLTVTAGLAMVIQGAYAYLVNGPLPVTVPDTKGSHHHRIDPIYLDEDENDDIGWWTWYGQSGYNTDYLYHHGHRYKIIGTTFYLKPEPVYDTYIFGRYNQKPTTLAASADTLLWSGFFYEVYKEGVVRIILKGISIPEVDADFAAYIKSEVENVLISRQQILPKRRTKKSQWL